MRFKQKLLCIYGQAMYQGHAYYHKIMRKLLNYHDLAYLKEIKNRHRSENMKKNIKSKQNVGHKVTNDVPRLRILILPAGFLLVILLAFCVISSDPWYIVIWECMKEVMLHGGFLITMLVNILWIAKAFVKINSFDSSFFEDENGKVSIKSMGIKHPLLKSPNKGSESCDYSFLFYEMTVRFLILVGLEISLCYIFFSNSLSDVLALTMPMVTIFIVCSCFLASRNDRLVNNVEEQAEKGIVKVNIKKMINKLNYPFRIYNINKGVFCVSIDAMRIISDDTEIQLTELEVQHAHGKMQLLSTSKKLGTFEIFTVSENQINFWKDVRDSNEIMMFLRYGYHSIISRKESEVTLVVILSLSNNQLRCL